MKSLFLLVMFVSASVFADSEKIVALMEAKKKVDEVLEKGDKRLKKSEERIQAIKRMIEETKQSMKRSDLSLSSVSEQRDELKDAEREYDELRSIVAEYRQKGLSYDNLIREYLLEENKKLIMKLYIRVKEVEKKNKQLTEIIGSLVEYQIGKEKNESEPEQKGKDE